MNLSAKEGGNNKAGALSHKPGLKSFCQVRQKLRGKYMKTAKQYRPKLAYFTNESRHQVLYLLFV